MVQKEKKWRPGLEGEVVYAGGLFNSMDMLPQKGMACLIDPGAASVDPTPAADSWLRLSPNPAIGPAEIEFTLARPGHVRLEVLDVEGRVRSRLMDEDRTPGPQRIVWSGLGEHGALSPGLYFIRLEAAGRKVAKQLVVVH